MPRESPAAALTVARVGETVITDADVLATMRRTGRTAPQALQDLIDFELLAAESARHGIKPSEAEDAARQTKVQRFLEQAVEPRLTPGSIGRDEARALYEKGKDHFVHARLVHVAVLAVFTGARMKPEARAKLDSVAHELAAAVAASPDRSPGLFEAIGHDERWQRRNVSYALTWQPENADAPFPAVLGRAVARLHHAGDTTDLVGDETGDYLGRYLDEKPPEHVSFEAAEASLRRDMWAPWRAQRFGQIAWELAGPHAIEEYPENLALVRVTDH